MTEIEKIDAVLNYLNHNKKEKDTFLMIMEGLPFKIEYKDLLLTINKLLKDGNIDLDFYRKDGIPSTEKHDRIYAITFDGRIFVSLGGYKKHIIDTERTAFVEETIKNLSIESLKDAGRIWNKGLIRTLITAVIGLVLGVLISKWSAKPQQDSLKDKPHLQSHNACNSAGKN